MNETRTNGGSQAVKSDWQRRQRRHFAAEHGYSTTAHYGAGGQRQSILERDGFKCVQCGMTDADHKAHWGRPITVDHRDRDRSNNTDENLQTLCLSCHGRKDQLPHLREPKLTKADLFRLYVMRQCGFTYQEAGDELGLSIGATHKWINRLERAFNEHGVTTN